MDALFHLRKLLEITIHLGRDRLGEWQLIWEITEALRGAEWCRPLSEAEAWGSALDAASEALSRSTFRMTFGSAPREDVVARALKFLARKGYPSVVDGRGARLTPPAFRRLCGVIEDKVARCGGLYTANAMLDLMQRSGRVVEGSFLHARTPTMLSSSRPDAGTPWHYIYNLALKHLDAPPRVGQPANILGAMEEIARALAASLNVQPHSAYENMSISRAGLGPILFETTLYDELFAFPQWQPLAGVGLVPLWVDALADAGCRFPTLAHEEWQAVAQTLIGRAQPCALVPVQAGDLVSFALPSERARTALALLAPATRPLNGGYRTPLDTSSRTSSWQPVLAAIGQASFLQPAAIAGRAFCERLYALMRDEGDPDIENKVGRALEILTGEALRSSGIQPVVSNGFYADGAGGRMEVDMVVETPERIFLFECTKKPLTSAARGGNTLSAMRDLEGSFLKLVQQLARHEAELRGKGAIRFTDGTVLPLRGRTVEKIGINLFDHGSLQSRDFTVALLGVVMGASVSTDSPEAAGTVEAINRRLRKLNASLMAILAAQPDGREKGAIRFAMSTWWLSVDQLRYILIKGQGDLWTGLSRIRHLTARSGDLVYEIKRSLELNEVGRAMLGACSRMDNRAMI